MFGEVEEIHQLANPGIILAEPKPDQWLYSVVVNLAELSVEEIMMAGEIEFYIYHSLWFARKSE
ncbi:MAG: hypothetical protein ABI675_19990 [Chitinophagaceae bacterium]